jgi:hypothetical protein
MKYILFLLSLTTAFAFADSSPEDCARRVREAGCTLSVNNIMRIKDRVDKCRHMQSQNGNTELEIFLLDRSDKMVVVETSGANVRKPNCPVTKYSLDSSGVKNFKILGNKAFIVSNDQRLYVMMPDQQVYELTGVGSILEVKGTNGGQEARLVTRRGGEKLLSAHELNRMLQSSWESHRVNFIRTTSERSLFRDE